MLDCYFIQLIVLRWMNVWISSYLEFDYYFRYLHFFVWKIDSRFRFQLHVEKGTYLSVTGI